MGRFQVSKVISLNTDGVDPEKTYGILTSELYKYFDVKKIEKVNADNLINIKFKGNLKGFWERAITCAEITINIKDDHLKLKAEGTSCLGAWPWLWFVLGFVTVFLFLFFLIDLIEFLICRDRPKQYFEEIFKSIEYESDTILFTEVEAIEKNKEILRKLEELAELKEKGVLTDGEFQTQKAKLLSS